MTRAAKGICLGPVNEVSERRRKDMIYTVFVWIGSHTEVVLTTEKYDEGARVVDVLLRAGAEAVLGRQRKSEVS
jgi:hypothetical protein